MVGIGRQLGAEGKGLWRQQAPDCEPTPATSCVALGKSFNLPGPHFGYHENAGLRPIPYRSVLWIQ